jgi:hypothetical protein
MATLLLLVLLSKRPDLGRHKRFLGRLPAEFRWSNRFVFLDPAYGESRLLPSWRRPGGRRALARLDCPLQLLFGVLLALETSKLACPEHEAALRVRPLPVVEGLAMQGDVVDRMVDPDCWSNIRSCAARAGRRPDSPRWCQTVRRRTRDRGGWRRARGADAGTCRCSSAGDTPCCRRVPASGSLRDRRDAHGLSMFPTAHEGRGEASVPVPGRRAR